MVTTCCARAPVRCTRRLPLTSQDIVKLITRRQAELGLNDVEAARACGVHPWTLYSWRTGRREPTMDIALRVLQWLGLQISIQ